MKNNFKFLILLSMSFLSIPASLTKAQEINETTSMKNLKQVIVDGRDILQETFITVEKQKNELLLSHEGLSKDVNKILRELKNPFIPQIPEAPEPQPQNAQIPEASKIPEPNISNQQSSNDHILAKPKTPPPTFSLSGLIWNSDLPQAILNGEVVTVGDTIKDCKVTKITREGVELIFQEQTFKVEP